MPSGRLGGWLDRKRQEIRYRPPQANLRRDSRWDPPPLPQSLRSQCRSAASPRRKERVRSDRGARGRGASRRLRVRIWGLALSELAMRLRWRRGTRSSPQDAANSHENTTADVYAAQSQQNLLRVAPDQKDEAGDQDDGKRRARRE